MKSYYVYKVTEKTTGEFYIGRRTSNVVPHLDTAYLGSMRVWKPKKENLIKEILYEASSIEELSLAEIKFISIWFKHSLNRNFSIPSEKFHCLKRSEESRKKQASTMTGRKFSQEHRENLSISQKTSEKAKAAHDARKGIAHSEETKKKIRDGNRGKIISEETKDKLRGRVFTEESRQKMSKSAKKRVRTPHSEETKQKISNSKRKK